MKQAALIDDIQKYLLDASRSQVERFAKQVERLQALKGFLTANPDAQGELEPLLAHAEKALEYQRPYRIAVIGKAGMGKSTLINAMLGRKLLKTRQGKATTGTALEIFLDAPPNGDEKALVTYRDQANIGGLISDFLTTYQLYNGHLPPQLDHNVAQQLRRLEAPNFLTEEGDEDFKEIRNSLADMVAQYANVTQNGLRHEFSLTDERDVTRLLELTDENSRLNENPQTRQIGLVRSITYHIKPVENKRVLQTLNLPHNVCLVDLPGLDGTALHDIILNEGLKEADAVILITRPPRILGTSDTKLLTRIRKYIGLDGSPESAERVFLVLNARDDIIDEDGSQSDIRRAMQELMTLLARDYAIRFAKRGGEQPYFMTAAFLAYSAQRAIQGQEIEAQNSHEGQARKLGVDPNDYKAVLEASDIPLLTTSLTEFAHQHRIEGQIRTGQKAIDRMVGLLLNKYESEVNWLTQGRGDSYIHGENTRLLSERHEDMREMLRKFRRKQLDGLRNLSQELSKEAEKLCHDIAVHLQSQMPSIWKQALTSDDYDPTAVTDNYPLYKTLLGKTEIKLWHQWTNRLDSLTNSLVNTYRHAIESEQVPQRLKEMGYGHSEITTIDKKVDELINRMGDRLAKFSERLPIVYMLQPEARFITPNSPNQPRPELVAALERVPPKREVDSSQFKAFITAVRQSYEPIVRGAIIMALLNVYDYEMLHIEEQLLNQIDLLFYHLHAQVVDDSALQLHIHESEPNTARKQVTLLYEKINQLRPLIAQNRVTSK